MYKIWCWSSLMLSSTLVQIWIKYYISCFMYYLLPITQKVEKITEFVSESIPKFICIIWENIGWIWGLPFMNLNKLDVKNKNTNLYCIFYILFIRNQRKNWLPNKYRFRPFSSLLPAIWKTTYILNTISPSSRFNRGEKSQKQNGNFQFKQKGFQKA